MMLRTLLLCRQMGFDSGDGVHHYVLPGSYKASAKDVELTTNVGVLGRWLFRVDGDTVVAGRIAAGGLFRDIIRKTVLIDVDYYVIVTHGQLCTVCKK